MKIKIFRSTDLERVQIDVNNWLSDERFVVTSWETSEHDKGYTIALMYKEA